MEQFLLTPVAFDNDNDKDFYSSGNNRTVLIVKHKVKDSESDRRLTWQTAEG